MSFDTADLEQMEADGTLGDVITHEMGHVLGIGSIWQDKRLLQGVAGSNPTFTGPTAMAEYAALLEVAAPPPVPVENTGGAGTRGAHWRETVFRNELMSGFIDDTPAIRSAGSPWRAWAIWATRSMSMRPSPTQLPDLLSVAESGELVGHTAPIGRGVMLGMIPSVLPDDALA